MAKKNTVEIILAAKDHASKITKQAFNTVQSSAQAALSAVKTASLAAAGALATLSGVVLKVGVDYNAMKEQSAIAWETILGSAEEAKKTLQELQTMGAKTPFEFEGLDRAAKLLNMAGFEGEKLFSTLTAVGDAVSAVGGGQEELEGVSMAIFQMASKGKISAEEINQLAERGIPAWQMMADSMGKTVPELMKMSEQGKLFAKDVLPELIDGMANKFGGAMDKQSTTFNGLMSTLKDNAKILAGVLTQDLFERLKGYLPPIINLMERFTTSFQTDGMKGVMNEFLPPGVVDFLITSFQQIKDTFNSVRDTFIQNKDQIVEVFEHIKGIIQIWVDYIKALFSGEGNIGQSFIRIFEAIKSIALPILQDAISFIKDALNNLKRFWEENGAQIVQAVQNVWSIIATIFETIAPVILFIVKMLWTNVKGVIQGALNVIMGLIKVFVGLFTGDFSKMWEGVKQIFIGAVEAIWNLMNLMFYGKIVAGLKTLGKEMLTNVQYYWTLVKEWFEKLAVTAKDKVIGMVQSILQWFRDLFTQSQTIFSMLRQFGENIFLALWNTLKSVASNIFYSVKSYFDELFVSAQNTFNNIWTTATKIFNSIKEAIISPIKTAKDTVLEMIDKIKNAFNFEWKLPKLKLPHVSVSMKKGAMGIPIPDFDVEWYDKGGVFYGPQIIGVGEKRPEFVGALDDLKSIVRQVFREENKTGYQDNRIINITVDARNISELQRVIELLTGLKQATRRA
jgi:tape measure domain-containing protein